MVHFVIEAVAGMDLPTLKINLTDSDSRLMRKNMREGYTPSYNNQTAVDADEFAVDPEQACQYVRLVARLLRYRLPRIRRTR